MMCHRNAFVSLECVAQGAWDTAPESRWIPEG